MDNSFSHKSIKCFIHKSYLFQQLTQVVLYCCLVLACQMSLHNIMVQIQLQLAESAGVLELDQEGVAVLGLVLRQAGDVVNRLDMASPRRDKGEFLGWLTSTFPAF